MLKSEHFGTVFSLNSVNLRVITDESETLGFETETWVVSVSVSSLKTSPLNAKSHIFVSLYGTFA